MPFYKIFSKKKRRQKIGRKLQNCKTAVEIRKILIVQPVSENVTFLLPLRPILTNDNEKVAFSQNRMANNYLA